MQAYCGQLMIFLLMTIFLDSQKNVSMHTLFVVLNMTVLDWKYQKNIVTSVIIDGRIWIILISDRNKSSMEILSFVRNHNSYLEKRFLNLFPSVDMYHLIRNVSLGLMKLGS